MRGKFIGSLRLDDFKILYRFRYQARIVTVPVCSSTPPRWRPLLEENDPGVQPPFGNTLAPERYIDSGQQEGYRTDLR
jgi:hypothetical protein